MSALYPWKPSRNGRATVCSKSASCGCGRCWRRWSPPARRGRRTKAARAGISWRGSARSGHGLSRFWYLAKVHPPAAHAPLCLSASPPRGGRSHTAAFPLLSSSMIQAIAKAVTQRSPPSRARCRQAEGGVSCRRTGFDAVRQRSMGDGIRHFKILFRSISMP